MRWWLLVWALTSVALAAWASTVEYGLVVVLVYVGANALAVAITWSRRPPVPPGFLTAVGWAAAFQLPVVFVVYFDPVDMKRRIDQQASDPGADEEWNQSITLLARPGLRRRRERDRTDPGR